MHGVIEWPLDFQWNGHSFLRINRMGPRSLSVPLSFRLSVSCACTLTLCHPTSSSLSLILSLPFSPSRYILFYFLPWLCRRLYCNATEASLCAILATTMCEAIVICGVERANRAWLPVCSSLSRDMNFKDARTVHVQCKPESYSNPDSKQKTETQASFW